MPMTTPLSDCPCPEPDGAGRLHIRPRRPARPRCVKVVLVLACLLLPAWTGVAPAAAQPGAAQPQPAAALNDRIVQQVQRYLQEQTASLPGEIRITVNAPDDRTRLAGCDELQVSLAPGARAWGQVPVGVRCVRPQPWQIYVPATVRVSAPVVVAARALVPGSVVDAADLTTRVEELTALPASVLQDTNLAVGRIAASAVPAGSVLRAENLKQVLAVVNGQTVRVVYESATLSVTSEGRALGNASVGQGVEVRVGSGKTVRGIVRSNGVVVIQ